MQNFILLFYVSLTMILGIYFLVNPFLDLVLANDYYQVYGSFVAKDIEPYKFIYYSSYPIYKFLLGSYILLLATRFFYRKNFFYPKIFTNEKVIYLLSCLIVGPYLFVHGIAKPIFNRPRPSQLFDFGGEYGYVPPFVMNSQCQDCASFVSGHAAMSVYFIAFVYAFPSLWKILTPLVMFYFVIMAETRMLQGGHFLSDVIFGGLSSLLICHLLYVIIFKYIFKKP